MAHYLQATSVGSHSFCVDVSVQKVHCDRGHMMDRNEFQERLSLSNPQWKAFADELERTGQKPRTNPDGDVCPISPGVFAYLIFVSEQVALEGVSYDKFVVPDCPSCLAENRKNSFVSHVLFNLLE